MIFSGRIRAPTFGKSLILGECPRANRDHAMMRDANSLQFPPNSTIFPSKFSSRRRRPNSSRNAAGRPTASACTHARA